MSSQNYSHAKFGIDEIYFRESFTNELLEKLYRRSKYTLDGEDNIVQKHVTHDMILIFYKQVPNQSLIYRFLKTLDEDVKKKDFIEANTLDNESELLPIITSKTFVLVTHRTLVKETYSPNWP